MQNNSELENRLLSRIYSTKQNSLRMFYLFLLTAMTVQTAARLYLTAMDDYNKEVCNDFRGIPRPNSAHDNYAWILLVPPIYFCWIFYRNNGFSCLSSY